MAGEGRKGRTHDEDDGGFFFHPSFLPRKGGEGGKGCRMREGAREREQGRGGDGIDGWMEEEVEEKDGGRQARTTNEDEFCHATERDKARKAQDWQRGQAGGNVTFAREDSVRAPGACGVNETRHIIAKTGQRQFAEEGRKAEESCALFGAVGILQIQPFTQSVVAFPERNSVPTSHPLPSRMISVKLEFPVRTRSSN